MGDRFNAKLGASSSGNFKVKFSAPTQDLTLKNQSTQGSRLDTLGDVDTSVSQANGSILVYDASTDTYVQRDILTYDPVTGAFNLDGGQDGF
jgi:hypothetical protein